jgi:hypothetical protein
MGAYIRSAKSHCSAHFTRRKDKLQRLCCVAQKLMYDVPCRTLNGRGLDGPVIERFAVDENPTPADHRAPLRGGAPRSPQKFQLIHGGG